MEYNLFENEKQIIKYAEELVSEPDADHEEIKDCLVEVIDAFSRSYREQKCLIRVSDRQQDHLREVKEELLAKTLLLERQAVDLKVLNEDLAAEVAIRKKAEEELRILASTDALTGVNNRRKLMEVLEGEIRRAKRKNWDLSLMVLDIDHFKRVNDTYGHVVGDQVLCHFVTAIKDSIRDIDVVGRIGGEEFVVLLPEIPIEQGVIVAERVRATVEGRAVVLPQDTLNITVSIGIAEMQTGELSKHLLIRADKAMYSAKEKGRNRVEIA